MSMHKQDIDCDSHADVITTRYSDKLHVPKDVFLFNQCQTYGGLIAARCLI